MFPLLMDKQYLSCKSHIGLDRFTADPQPDWFSTFINETNTRFTAVGFTPGGSCIVTDQGVGLSAGLKHFSLFEQFCALSNFRAAKKRKMPRTCGKLKPTETLAAQAITDLKLLYSGSVVQTSKLKLFRERVNVVQNTPSIGQQITP